MRKVVDAWLKAGERRQFTAEPHDESDFFFVGIADPTLNAGWKDAVHLNEEEARQLRDDLTAFLGDGLDNPISDTWVTLEAYNKLKQAFEKSHDNFAKKVMQHLDLQAEVETLRQRVASLEKDAAADRIQVNPPDDRPSPFAEDELPADAHQQGLQNATAMWRRLGLTDDQPIYGLQHDSITTGKSLEALNHPTSFPAPNSTETFGDYLHRRQAEAEADREAERQRLLALLKAQQETERRAHVSDLQRQVDEVCEAVDRLYRATFPDREHV